MNTKVMNKISYGLYVLTSRCGNQFNGCIINTLAQVTTSPNRVSITVNKGNFSEYMIRSSGRFNVSIIDESADFSLFKRFGFASGRWENKFFGCAPKLAANGIPVMAEGVCGYVCCEVVQSIDLGTHTMFIADVADGEVTSQNAPMTYSYYHANVKPKPAASAQKSENVGERWVCNICGYIHEGALPADFVCPVCKHGAADFSQIDKDGNVVDSKPAAGGEAWVCTVCGYVHEGALPEGFTCPKCKAGADKFTRRNSMEREPRFDEITACGGCCTSCRKKLDGECPGCIEADGYVPGWAESGRCKIHACTREHGVRFCGLCAEFPCAEIEQMIHWKKDIIPHMRALAERFGRE